MDCGVDDIDVGGDNGIFCVGCCELIGVWVRVIVINIIFIKD